ncbi:MAG: hypothetical protein IKJ91_11455 [Clostridia bacterium]|nr:hypothetical protein [Clostridia bacterium]
MNNKKRPLFVFAGQSNMMGAPVYEASEQIYFKNSFEYLHKKRRFGFDTGEFRQEGFPCGEFSYKDLKAAYGEDYNDDSKSTLATFSENTFFAPSMSNLDDEKSRTVFPFAHFSEANSRKAPSLPPYIVKGLEDNGFACAYTHIAKGSAPIGYYLEGDAKEYFYLKVRDFFADSEKCFSGDDTSERVFVWLQGESDRMRGFDYYYKALFQLWSDLKKAGFTKFFMIRVPYWNGDEIADIMRAEEEFCKQCDDAYMITRVCSFIPWRGQNVEEWFDGKLEEEFEFCRDSFHGFPNQHINEKGFKLVAKYAVPNIIRVLFEGLPPIMEKERIKCLQ